MPATDTRPALCLRCGGRVVGLIHKAIEPYRAVLALVEWKGVTKTDEACCPTCGARAGLYDGEDRTFRQGLHHEACPLAAALGVPRLGGSV